MGQTLYLVDAFTARPFAGNPAAICILPAERPESWMQQLAMEMNQAETAFLLTTKDGYSLRWFTPTVEVDLCGHATLAAAHILWETGTLPTNETARFHTRSGLLTARKESGKIVLDFPAVPAAEAVPPAGLLESLDVSPLFVGKNTTDYLVELETEGEVRELRPDFRRLSEVAARGIIVTAKATGSDYAFISRFFAPASGVNEDPVTGSAHCCLGPYWAAKTGRNDLTGFQASPRGGFVQICVQGERVLLGGQAVTVLQAELRESTLAGKAGY